MEFNEGKFEQMSHGHTENVREGTYKTKSGKEIKPKKTVKDLGVLISKNMSFKEHINDVVQSCKVMIGLLVRSFETREKRNDNNVQLIHKKQDGTCKPGLEYNGEGRNKIR